MQAKEIEFYQRKYVFFSKIKFLLMLLHQNNVVNIFSGVPTVVKTNILIRSMGPVSELDMVRLNEMILHRLEDCSLEFPCSFVE